MDWHQYRRSQLSDHDVVPFNLFASWIDIQSQVYLDNLKVAKTQATKATLPNKSPLYNTTTNNRDRVNAGVNLQPTTRPIHQQANPGASKEYRDVLRSQQSKTRIRQPPQHTSARSEYTPPSSPRFDRPLASSTRAPSPSAPMDKPTKYMEMRCAWCFSNQRPHNHTTYDCFLFKNALNIKKKWDVIQKYNICSACLSHDHTVDQCNLPTLSSCAQCNVIHHSALGCRSAPSALRSSPSSNAQ